MLFWLLACGGQPEGWVASEQTGGPTVMYDLTAEPLPEIPYPTIRQLVWILRQQQDVD